jgi:hypothetical protein
MRAEKEEAEVEMKKKRVQVFKQRGVLELDDNMEDTELLRRLRAWKQQKKEYEE